MRLSDEMNFPHPVLASWRDDFSDGRFDVEVIYREGKSDGRLELAFTGALESVAINALIDDGKAMLGCFVICRSTGVRRLVELGTLPSSCTFARGELLDTVNLRPLVWSTAGIAGWSPEGVHDEFKEPQTLRKGDIIAMSEELTIEVNKADLPALETIFDLKVNEGLSDGQFEIDMMRERITILASRETYNLVVDLRVITGASAAAVMNSLYVPVVMSVLTEIARGGAEQFEDFRWLEPFRRRYLKLDITPDIDTAFKDAQRLLDMPFHDLKQLTGLE
tara:strand:- start:935 stop:1768 length:834 start_codon:yes stop_codon:yes gene_type:complete